MKTMLAFLFLILSVFPSLRAQSSFYDLLNLGSFTPGYSDTVIYDSRFTYEAYGYQGSKPYFVQVWHPLEKTKEANFLSVADFRMKNLPFLLSEVVSQLQAETDTVILSNCGLAGGDTETRDVQSPDCPDLLERYYQLATRSVRAAMPVESNKPLIVYHHGSQGSAAENLAMAEYFASRGYIFCFGKFSPALSGTAFWPQTIQSAHKGRGGRKPQGHPRVRPYAEQWSPVLCGPQLGSTDGVAYPEA